MAGSLAFSRQSAHATALFLWLIYVVFFTWYCDKA
jgi:hypothetical protein